MRRHIDYLVGQPILLATQTVAELRPSVAPLASNLRRRTQIQKLGKCDSREPRKSASLTTEPQGSIRGDGEYRYQCTIALGQPNR